MSDRLSSLAFWAVFLLIILAVAYPTIQGLREDQSPKQQASPVAVRLTPLPVPVPSVVKAAPRTPVRLAAHAQPVEPLRRWVPDTDFAYSGRWEHVRKRYDGRTNGSSSRSFHGGARASFTFTGQSVRLYGVVGPGGGLGVVNIDGRLKHLVRFYSPVKSVHKLVYTSPPLAPGTHRFSISVLSDRTLQATRARYVNIGGADV